MRLKAYQEDAIESDIEREAAKYAELRGWFEAKIAKSNKNGLPDRLFIRNGRVIFIEFKKPGEPLRRDQKVRIAQMRAHGAEVHVCDNPEAAKDVLY